MSYFWEKPKPLQALFFMGLTKISWNFGDVYLIAPNVLKRVSLCYGVRISLANDFRTYAAPKFIAIINTIFWESKITA